MTQEIDWGEVSKKLKAAFTKIERENPKNFVLASMKRKKSEGQHLGSPAYGFKMVDKELQRIESEHNIIALANSMRTDGATLREIANELNKQGIKTKRGCDWNPVQIKRLMR
tara:strand:+ start:106 stop:441 length:336 start_codon:yes stop_codon:yes gene_type:complete